MLHGWQMPSAAARLDLTEVLIRDVDMDPILDQMTRSSELAAFSPQAGPYHNGRWQRVGLVAPGGDPTRTYGRAGERAEKTPVLRAMPALEAIIDRFDGEVRAASLSRMEPGARVRWHVDGRQSIDLAYARLHLPLVTSPAATMRIGHQTVHLDVGQLWYWTSPSRMT